MARFLIDCLNSHTVVTMLAHDKDHTEKLLRRAQEFLDNMNGAKPKISRSNENEMYFPKTQSQFYIGTAGSKNFGRSATITRLHMSELAFWKDPKAIRTGLLQAVPSTGQVVEETTANGYGTWYQQHYYRMMTNPVKMFPIFFGWNYDNEYTSLTPLSSPLTKDEIELQHKYNLSLEQIQWRREKLEQFEYDLSLFKQEYPLSIEEAFRFSGGSLFGMVQYEPCPEWIQDDEGWILKGHPNPTYSYALGADSSGGTGNDEAAISIFCLETKEQVYEFASNRMPPPTFAPIVVETGLRFNEAYIVAEANSHGLSTLDYIKRHYPTGRLFKRGYSKTMPQKALTIPSFQYGWQTTQSTKAYAIGVAQFLLSDGFIVHSPEAASQLRAFTEDADTHQIINSADHDDKGMAAILALVGMQKLYRFAGLQFQPEEPTEEEKFEEHKKIVSMRQWRDEQGRFLYKLDDVLNAFPSKRSQARKHLNA